jgi:hypothetical protein
MRKNYIIIASLIFTSLLFSNNIIIIRNNAARNVEILSREIVDTIYVEDFENGLDEWDTIDVTDPGSFWSTSEFNAYGGSGKSWRMANPEILPDGGYLDSWYQVLDTPAISLPNSDSLTISFVQYRAIEELGGTGNFDGWDGFNIRIRNSDQDYEEAEILTDCIPAYNSTSMYSFGYEHNEDPDGIPGIPGWGGSTDWTTTIITIPVSYLGEDVIISFAFASDPSTSTTSNPEYTGVFIDNIDVAGVFTNNGNIETGFFGFSNKEKGGDLWHVFDDSNAPSTTSALGCFDVETGFYNPNMENYIEGPIIQLPVDSQLFFDMYLRSELDNNSFPDCDYFSIEVQYHTNLGWSSWNSISNPLGDPNGINAVFTGSVNDWTLFSENWFGYNDLSTLAGYNIKLRIGFHSNSNQPSTFGVQLDDIMITTVTYPGSPPENNTAILLEDRTIMLGWNEPYSPGCEGFNVYHSTSSASDYALAGSTTDTTFIHTEPITDSYNYYVINAIYDGEESQYSNEAYVFVPSPTADILMHDDGTCESAYNCGILNNMAVKFTPNYNQESQTLTHINICIESLNSGPLVIKIWGDNGGFPGSLLVNPISYSSSELVQGWNTLIIPTCEQPVLTQGSFFAGIQEFACSSTFGLDENSFGFSYSDSNGWELLEIGNIMIRTIVDSDPTGTEQELIPKNKPTMLNYPNPFNPETTIRMDIHYAEKATLKIFNTKGQLIRTLYDGYLEAGNKIIKWNGLDNNNKKVTSGVYFCNLQTEDCNITKKMLMLK